jgi:A/G-specific adenine glycosylase
MRLPRRNSIPQGVSAVSTPTDEIGAFREVVLGYYREHGRDLPWRRTTDPYAVLVSEVMLQQTQVPRVLPTYAAFLARFPDVGALAAAPLAEVLAVWSGLGYNRRAKSLKAAAEMIVEKHGGRVPDTVEGLTSLPGIGYATAAQVLAFAFGVGVPFLETNVRSVILHHFFEDAEQVPDAALLPLVEATLDHGDPRTWYWALMDYGTYLKRALPNPSRRSAHHTRQGRFEGSNRQLRGWLLRELTARPGQSADALATAAPLFPHDQVAAALATLTAEGFLVQTGRRFRIA